MRKLADEICDFLNPILVHGRPYELRFYDNVDHHGEINHDKRIIQLDIATLDDIEFSFCPTLVHEIEHASLIEGGLSEIMKHSTTDKENKEESICRNCEMGHGPLIFKLFKPWYEEKVNECTGRSKKKKKRKTRKR